jgi:hypothetical protein
VIQRAKDMLGSDTLPVSVLAAATRTRQPRKRKLVQLQPGPPAGFSGFVNTGTDCFINVLIQLKFAEPSDLALDFELGCVVR